MPKLMQKPRAVFERCKNFPIKPNINKLLEHITLNQPEHGAGYDLSVNLGSEW